MLRVTRLNVIALSVVMLSVGAPLYMAIVRQMDYRKDRWIDG